LIAVILRTNPIRAFIGGSFLGFTITAIPAFTRGHGDLLK
jgi:hypothetical protein